jgi:hypothetical protein
MKSPTLFPFLKPWLRTKNHNETAVMLKVEFSSNYAAKSTNPAKIKRSCWLIAPNKAQWINKFCPQNRSEVLKKSLNLDSHIFAWCVKYKENSLICSVWKNSFRMFECSYICSFTHLRNISSSFQKEVEFWVCASLVPSNSILYYVHVHTYIPWNRRDNSVSIQDIETYIFIPHSLVPACSGSNFFHCVFILKRYTHRSVQYLSWIVIKLLMN